MSTILESFAIWQGFSHMARQELPHHHCRSRATTTAARSAGSERCASLPQPPAPTALSDPQSSLSPRCAATPCYGSARKGRANPTH